MDSTLWNFSMTPWASDQHIARLAPQQYSTYRKARVWTLSMRRMDFEPTLPMLERPQTLRLFLGAFANL